MEGVDGDEKRATTKLAEFAQQPDRGVGILEPGGVRLDVVDANFLSSS